MNRNKEMFGLVNERDEVLDRRSCAEVRGLGWFRPEYAGRHPYHHRS